MRRLFAILAGVLACSVVAVPAAAGPPTVQTYQSVFVETDPCTDLPHTVTYTGTVSSHYHDGRVIIVDQRTITTDPTGFVGGGTIAYQYNGTMITTTRSDLLRNASGDLLMVRYVVVLDVAAETYRVNMTEYTCVGPA
jgi:hypothetical protein